MDKELDNEIYHDLNRRIFFQGNLESQRKVLLTRILKLSMKNNLNVFFQIGEISFGTEQFQRSLIQLKKAMIINPENSSAHIQSATLFFKLEKEKEGFSILKNVFYLEPFSDQAHDAVTKIFQERERLEDLVLFYQETANFLPDAQSIVYLYCGCGQALVDLNEYPKALEMFKKAFETHQMDAQNHFQYAMALWHEDLFDEAIIQFEHAREQDPGDKDIINNIASLHYCAGRFQKAFEKFEFIIENGLVSVGTYPNFSLVLKKMEKSEEVINRYEHLLH